MISDQLLITQFLILMIYRCKGLAKGQFLDTDAIFILDDLVNIISGWFLKARWNNLQRYSSREKEGTNIDIKNIINIDIKNIT